MQTSCLMEALPLAKPPSGLQSPPHREGRHLPSPLARQWPPDPAPLPLLLAPLRETGFRTPQSPAPPRSPRSPRHPTTHTLPPPSRPPLPGTGRHILDLLAVSVPESVSECLALPSGRAPVTVPTPASLLLRLRPLRYAPPLVCQTVL